MHDTIVTIRHLQKRFGDVQAVRDVSLQVRRGELFAFLGLNGAGKSTTISILCGQLARDGGDVLIDGQSIDENTDGLKQMLGVVFQNSVLDKALSVRDNLRVRAALYGISGAAYKERLAELAALLEFEDLLGRPVGKLSGGQRRRIDVARALLHRPRLLILDEPTTGLDPQTRATLWGVIARLRKETQMTVFLTTHYMEEAAEADYITILDSGEVAAEGTPLQLKNAYAEDALLLYGAEEQDVQALGRPYERKQNAFRIPVRTPEEATALILQKPALFKDFELLKGSMDDVFLRVTGKTLPGGDAQ